MWTIIRLRYKLWGNLLSDSNWAACHCQGNFIVVKINWQQQKKSHLHWQRLALHQIHKNSVLIWNLILEKTLTICRFLDKAPFMFFSQIKKVYKGDDEVKSLTTIQLPSQGRKYCVRFRIFRKVFIIVVWLPLFNKWMVSLCTCPMVWC